MDIKALTFDTGGTILDWHTGFSTALAAIGKRHGVTRDWHALANEMRRRALKKMVNLGEHQPPAYNFDGAHRQVLDEILGENALAVASEAERRALWWDTVHNLQCWPDFPATLPKLRARFICASFTILSFRIIIDTARRNGLSWDAVISCEAIGKYKVLPRPTAPLHATRSSTRGSAAWSPATTSTSMPPRQSGSRPRSCAVPTSGVRPGHRIRRRALTMTSSSIRFRNWSKP